MNKSTPLPWDIRIMNITSGLLLMVLLCLSLGVSGWWILRHKMFDIQEISVYGDVSHHNDVTLRANVLPQLSGNFFTLSLRKTQLAFEAMPWVRKAVVRREFPNRLRVRLEEHHPVALWGTNTDTQMVNQVGQVFEANVEDIEADSLPILTGPEGQSVMVWQMYQHLLPIFSLVSMGIDKLELTPRGSWRVLTDGDATIELGRGTQEEVGQRLKTFLQTVAQVTSRYQRTSTSLLAADLRHTNGYALRLRGVTTLVNDGNKKP
ncbi:cell division protein FtsQ/DivIB [Limnohabitans sp. Rim8]|uniref:cell division protein FtsQ/DivIB n=1 Tax=Limnohabitans sp. Rim8 TaxID=1100718 RepID=UPI00261C58AC|nr:cell division protein FtsQ/DivIB [Limnohabitans sp. Rim8]